jgi:DNA-binding NarL/FixJ family response regulator
VNTQLSAIPHDNHVIAVFVADDSLVVRERLVALLGELRGIEIVGQAGDVPTAIQAIHQIRPDVVFLDISMAGGSGLDILQSIRQSEHVPLVAVITNFGHTAYRNHCLRAGADFFFDKSTEFNQISSVFEQFKHYTVEPDQPADDRRRSV